MSRDHDAICTKCGKSGHRASSCTLPTADHSAEPWDGTDRDMGRCVDCVYHRGTCRNRYHLAGFIPALREVPQRCAGFEGVKR